MANSCTLHLWSLLCFQPGSPSQIFLHVAYLYKPYLTSLVIRKLWQKMCESWHWSQGAQHPCFFLRVESIHSFILKAVTLVRHHVPLVNPFFCSHLVSCPWCVYKWLLTRFVTQVFQGPKCCLSYWVDEAFPLSSYCTIDGRTAIIEIFVNSLQFFRAVYICSGQILGFNLGDNNTGNCEQETKDSVCVVHLKVKSSIIFLSSVFSWITAFPVFPNLCLAVTGV